MQAIVEWVDLSWGHSACGMVKNVNARARVLALLAVFCCSFILASAQDQASVEGPGIDRALVARALAGDAPSMLLVAKAYAAGSGVDQDDAIAANWYRKAADLGNIEGEIRLAGCYRDGKGVSRDMTQAATWYRKAAEQGESAAQATLGSLYSVGQGVSRDDVEAYFWFDLAASSNGPNQEKYAANRQNVGTRITADDVALVRQRVAKWKAAHGHRATGE